MTQSHCRHLQLYNLMQKENVNVNLHPVTFCTSMCRLYYSMQEPGHAGNYERLMLCNTHKSQLSTTKLPSLGPMGHL